MKLEKSATTFESQALVKYGAFELKRAYQKNLALGIIIAGLLFVIPTLFIPPSTVAVIDSGLSGAFIPALPNTLIVEREPGVVDTLIDTLPPPPDITHDTLVIVPLETPVIGIPEPVPPDSDSTVSTVVISTQEVLSEYLRKSEIVYTSRPDVVLREKKVIGTPRPGNTIKIEVYLINQGGEVEQLVGRLRSLGHNPRVRVHQTNNPFEFGTMAPSESKNNRGAPYRVTIPDDFIPGESLILELRLTGFYLKEKEYLKDHTFPVLVSETPSQELQLAEFMKEIFKQYWEDPARFLRDKSFKGHLGGGNAVYFDAASSCATIRQAGVSYEVKFEFPQKTIVDWDKGRTLLTSLSDVFMHHYCTDYPKSKYCKKFVTD